MVDWDDRVCQSQELLHRALLEEREVLDRVNSLKKQIRKFDLRSHHMGSPLTQWNELNEQLVTDRERLAKITTEIDRLKKKVHRSFLAEVHRSSLHGSWKPAEAKEVARATANEKETPVVKVEVTAQAVKAGKANGMSASSTKVEAKAPAAKAGAANRKPASVTKVEAKAPAKQVAQPSQAAVDRQRDRVVKLEGEVQRLRGQVKGTATLKAANQDANRRLAMVEQDLQKARAEASDLQEVCMRAQVHTLTHVPLRAHACIGHVSVVERLLRYHLCGGGSA